MASPNFGESESQEIQQYLVGNAKSGDGGGTKAASEPAHRLSYAASSGCFSAQSLLVTRSMSEMRVPPAPMAMGTGAGNPSSWQSVQKTPLRVLPTAYLFRPKRGCLRREMPTALWNSWRMKSLRPYRAAGRSLSCIGGLPCWPCAFKEGIRRPLAHVIAYDPSEDDCNGCKS